MKHFGTRTALAISGAILAVIGSWIMAAPTVFLAISEVIVENDAGLLSEVTAPSGLLIMAGTFMIISAIKVRLASLGLATGALVYGSYGFSRLVSQYLHGTPSDQLVTVMWFELAVATLLLALSPRVQSTPPIKQLNAFYQQVTQ